MGELLYFPYSYYCCFFFLFCFENLATIYYKSDLFWPLLFLGVVIVVVVVIASFFFLRFVCFVYKAVVHAWWPLMLKETTVFPGTRWL